MSFWNVFALADIAFLCALGFFMASGCAPTPHGSPTHIIEQDMVRAVSKPNKWRCTAPGPHYPEYLVLGYSSLFNNGLLSRIESFFEMDTARYTLIDKVKRSCIEIYRLSWSV